MTGTGVGARLLGMSAEIVNLADHRKQKARADKERKAAENRVRFGRAKVDKEREGTERTREERAWDGHKIDDKADDKDR